MPSFIWWRARTYVIGRFIAHFAGRGSDSLRGTNKDVIKPIEDILAIETIQVWLWSYLCVPGLAFLRPVDAERGFPGCFVERGFLNFLPGRFHFPPSRVEQDSPQTEVCI